MTNNVIRRFVFRILRYSLLPVLFREFAQKKRVTILLFHNISVETAEQTFRFLTKKYNIISLDNYLKIRSKKTTGSLPAKAVVITFDDGFKQNFELIPVLKKYNIPTTIFLCAGLVNTNRHFWFEENKSSYSTEALIKMANEEKLKVLSEVDFTPEKEYDTPQVLSKKQINEMKETLSFQSHGLFHPCLPKCSEEEAKNEIVNSKRFFEEEYGMEINAFAYPNGDYSAREIKMAKEAGYECGLTVDFGFNTHSTDLFRLKRICVNDADDLNELIVKASGLWDFFKTGNGRWQKHGFSEINKY